MIKLVCAVCTVQFVCVMSHLLLFMHCQYIKLHVVTLLAKLCQNYGITVIEMIYYPGDGVLFSSNFFVSLLATLRENG